MALFEMSKAMRDSLDKNYEEAKKNPTFVKLVKKLQLSDEEAKKYVTKLEQTIEELENSKTIHDVSECPNANPRYILIPEIKEQRLYFSYAPCTCEQRRLKEMEAKIDSSKELESIGMKDIDLKDKKRAQAIKWIGDFYKNYNYNTSTKGLFLTGSFGSGKTFLINALFNDLREKKGVTSEAVYFPDLLRQLKDDWDLYAYKMTRLQKVDLLLIDDIGAEKVTEWGRDEVLGTILQTRMNQKLPTFFTSNLTIDELEKHLSGSKNNVDQIKARRIIERIKQLSTEIELISENRRG